MSLVKYIFRSVNTIEEREERERERI